MMGISDSRSIMQTNVTENTTEGGSLIPGIAYFDTKSPYMIIPNTIFDSFSYDLQELGFYCPDFS